MPTGTGTDPIRVLHLLGSLERGGVETWLLDLLERIDRRRWQFDFCTLGPDPGRLAACARHQGSHVLSCPLRMTGDGGIWSFPWRLYRLLREGRYRLAHSHVHRFSGVVLAVARAAEVPDRIAHSHNTQDGRSNTFGRACYRWRPRR